MDKKYLIIIGTIAGLTLAGLAVFWLIGKPLSPPPETPANGAFPISGSRDFVPNPSIPTTPPPTIQPGRQKSLTQLVQKAIGGATYIEKEQSDKTKIGMVRYFEKATGHIYDIDYQARKSVRVSNTTIPGVFDAYWSASGEQAVIKYIEKSETAVEETARNFSLTAIGATTTGIFLSSAIKTIAASPKENKIFYLFPFEGNYVGLTASFADKSQKQLFTTPFGEFLAFWPSERIIALLTRPSFNIEGYLYKLDATTGSFEAVLKNIPGLTFLWSPDSEFILYNESGYSGFENYIHHVKENKVLPFNLATLPEKCAWSRIKKGVVYCAVPLVMPAANYPDGWYQGLISFSDRVWRIDVLSGATEIISAEAAENDFDFVNLFLDKNENYLFLQNKKDGALWSLQLSF